MSDEAAATASGEDEVSYAQFAGEHELAELIALVEQDLSEPYTIFTYRYFINNWPHACWLVSTARAVGNIVYS
jgi:N-alpha-acetyltransferase 30